MTAFARIGACVVVPEFANALLGRWLVDAVVVQVITREAISGARSVAGEALIIADVAFGGILLIAGREAFALALCQVTEIGRGAGGALVGVGSTAIQTREMTHLFT